MKIHRNEPLFVRSERVALVANLGGLAMLIAAVFVLFNSPGQLVLYVLFLIVGILLVQAGLYFGRHGRRTDLALDKALRSLADTYQIYHQLTPAQHLLTGPSGAWIIIPRHTSGQIHFDKLNQKWKNLAGNPIQRFWRWLTQERLGRPHFEAMIEAGRLDNFLQNEWNSKEDVPVHAVAVFLADEVQVEAGDAPFPAVTLKKLANTVSGVKQTQPFSKASLNRLNKILGQ